MTYQEIMAQIAANPQSSGLQQGYTEGSGENMQFFDSTPFSRTGSYFYGGKAITPQGDGTFLVYEPAAPGHASRLNGTMAEVVDGSGNVLKQQQLRGITDANSTQQMIGMLSVAIGGPLLGAALAGAAAGGAGAAGAAGGAEAAGAAGAGVEVGGALSTGLPAGAELGALEGAGYGGTSSWAGIGGTGGAGFGGAGYGSLATPALDAAGVGGAATYGGGYLAGMGGVDAAMGIGAAGAAGGAAGAGAGGAPFSPPTAPGYGAPSTIGSTITDALGGASGALGGWGGLIGPAANLVGGALGANAASNASEAQLTATREAAALSEPWRAAGTKALNRMQEILGIGGDSGAADYGINAKPFTFTQDDPSYQWRFDQGQKAVQNSAANRGGLFSGRAAKELERYGQGAASQEYQASFNRDQVTKASRLNPLQSLAGQGQTAATTIGGLTTDGGNAQAAGSVGSANAWSNAISGALNNYQTNELMNRLIRS